jgi:hypothetical protein
MPNERGTYGNRSTFAGGPPTPPPPKEHGGGGYWWLFFLGIASAGLFSIGKPMKWFDRTVDRFDSWRDRRDAGKFIPVATASRSRR